MDTSSIAGPICTRCGHHTTCFCTRLRHLSTDSRKKLGALHVQHVDSVPTRTQQAQSAGCAPWDVAENLFVSLNALNCIHTEYCAECPQLRSMSLEHLPCTLLCTKQRVLCTKLEQVCFCILLNLLLPCSPPTPDVRMGGAHMPTASGARPQATNPRCVLHSFTLNPVAYFVRWLNGRYPHLLWMCIT